MNEFGKVVISTIAGTITYLIGGFDTILTTLLLLMLVDIITGIIKGFKNKDLDSKIMSDGILKKASILLVIIVVNLLTHIFEPLAIARETVIVLYICNESLSIFENLGTYIELPQFIVKYLKQLHDETNDGGAHED